MANPNLINTTTAYLESNHGAVTTSPVTIVPYTSNKIKKIVSIYFCNTTASTITVSMFDANPGTDRYLLKDVDIPTKSTLVAVTKDTPIHFEDFTHNLDCTANALGVDFFVSWEEYDDA